MIDYKFYDTSSLLEGVQHSFFLEEILNYEEPFIISSITLKELERIKSNKDKSYEQKQLAQQVIRLINKNPRKFQIHFFKEQMLNPIKDADLLINDDMRILATAIDYDTNIHPDETIFVSNDISLRNIANLFFGNEMIEYIPEEEIDYYTGYKKIYMTNEVMSNFYMN